MGVRSTMRSVNALLAKNPQYTSSPYAANTLGLAQTLLNSRMAGAAARGRNIFGAQANMQANVNRNVTDSSQALAMGAAGQGQADASFGQMQQLEGQDYMNKLGNLNQANLGMTGEHKDVFDDSVRRWQDQLSGIKLNQQLKQQRTQSWINAAGVLVGAAGVAFPGKKATSDKRLKHNYHIVGKSPSGINIYEFSYLGSDVRYQGVMADEVKGASFVMDNGFLAVDYSKIDVEFKQV